MENPEQWGFIRRCILQTIDHCRLIYFTLNGWLCTVANVKILCPVDHRPIEDGVSMNIADPNRITSPPPDANHSQLFRLFVMLRSHNFTTFVPVILRTFSHPPAWEPNVLLFDYLFYQNDVFSPNLLRLAVDSSYFETRMMRFSKSSNRTRFK